MTWQIKYAKTFYRELAKVPKKTRKQVEDFVFGESVKKNPFETGKVEKLRKWSNFVEFVIDEIFTENFLDHTNSQVGQGQCTSKFMT